MENKMTEGQLEEIGLLIDKCDNYLHTTMLRLPAEMTIGSLITGLKEVRNDLFEIYKSNGGNLENVEELSVFDC